jgi:DNA-binding HxlR family transcriptional regulator
MVKRKSDCPINYSLEIFGDNWTLLIIRDIMFFDKTCYGDFYESAEGIATNILADRLRFLVSQKILKKLVSPKNKSKFIYRLTQKGIDLMPTVLDLVEWGVKYHRDTFPKKFMTWLRKDREGLMKHYREKAMLNPANSIPERRKQHR